MEEIVIPVASAPDPDLGAGNFRLRRMGEGAPIIFSHGAGFACDSFGDLTARLARTFSVHLLDLPGHGVNPSLSEAEFSLDLARDALQGACAWVMRHTGRAPALVCHSISGVLALRLRTEAPELMSALITYEPPLAQPDASQDISTADQSMLERRALRRRRTFARIEDLAARLAPRDGVPGLPPTAAFRVASGLLRAADDGGFALRCAPEVEAKIYRTNQHFGIWPRLRNPGPPVTIMAGRRTDASDYTADVALQVANVGAFDLIVLSGLTHLGWAEAPERAAPLIVATLERTIEA